MARVRAALDQLEQQGAIERLPPKDVRPWGGGRRGRPPSPQYQRRPPMKTKRRQNELDNASKTKRDVDF
jgi:hypothetical protein